MQVYFNMNNGFKNQILNTLMFYVHYKGLNDYFDCVAARMIVARKLEKIIVKDEHIELVDEFEKLIISYSKFNEKVCLVMKKILPKDLLQEIDDTMPFLDYESKHDSGSQIEFNTWTEKYHKLMFDNDEYRINIMKFAYEFTYERFENFISKQSRIVGDQLDEFMIHNPEKMEIVAQYFPHCCEGYLNMIYKKISRTLEHFKLVFNVRYSIDDYESVSVNPNDVPDRYYSLHQ